jgi:uncharacterized oxidoreductase
MKLNGNTILITGGATGIGFALAEAFLREGNTVIITGRRESKLLEAQKKLPGLHIKTCDVADAGQREELVQWVTTYFADVNVLVNNAGIQRDIDLKKGVEALTAGDDELKINLEAPIYLSALFIPYFKGKENAAILNVTSGLVFIPSVKAPLYSTTKAALHTFSIVLRQQLKTIGIKVFEVIPPLILDTELNPEGRVAGRAAAGGVPDHVRFAHLNLPTAAVFADAVLAKLEMDVFEIGHGMSEASLKASKQELDQIFQQMNK